MSAKRGEIWWASLPEPVDSSPGFRRPVLVIQANDFNKSAISTIIVIAISSNLRLGFAPGNVTLTKSDSKLAKSSIVNVSQTLTLDKTVLTERVGKIPDAQMRKVENGLRLVFGL